MTDKVRLQEFCEEHMFELYEYSKIREHPNDNYTKVLIEEVKI